MPQNLPPRIFLLSPANAGGARAGLLLNPRAAFPLARQFHHDGITLGEVFSFTSGLYFRGKLTYANRFARNEAGDLVRIITSNAGLLAPTTRIGLDDLSQFGTTEIDSSDPKYHKPFRRDAAALARQLGSVGTAILLGSIATPKYRDVLLEVFEDRLFFPGDFVGRGDMSRGALLLRAAEAGRELEYKRVQGAVLTGQRASKVNQVARDAK